MKKLIALITIITLLLSGCSLFGQAAEGGNGNLSDKLAGIELAEDTGQEATPEPTPEPTPEEDPEPTLDPYSSELLDPYDIRSFWGRSKDIDSFASAMGLSYNASETERLLKQVDFKLDIYTGPFNHTLPATDRAECYAYVAPTGNVFRFDYKYYISASASPEEVANTYYAAVDAMNMMVGKTKDLEIYSEKREGFTYEEIVEHVASDMDYYSFRTAFGSKANAADSSSVMLLQRDGVLSLIMQWILPLDESPISQGASSTSENDSSAGKNASSTSESSGSSGSSSSAGNSSFDISLGGIMDPDVTDPRYDPAEGYILQISDFDVTPNSNGGYDCYITFINPSSYDTKFGIDAWLYGGYEEADIIPLAQSYWIHNDGSAETFYFEINYPPANGMWEVWFDCRFW
ncbi:hypothetical protein LJC56_08340 [Christensenellaceae bacterium OttesenSCG-928-K19]|nr:hypothetical protein [Christensenellaceae bacterium OttesenSCG-928-K19]